MPTVRTHICDELGIEFPIFASTHCRDIVVAVSTAGGLGAVGFTPEQLEIELNWINENTGDHTYGVDIVIPNKYEGMDANVSGDELAEMLRKMVPQQHLDFRAEAAHRPRRTDRSRARTTTRCSSRAGPRPPRPLQVDVALRHPRMPLIANALGTPPADMIEHIHASGRKVAALCGSPYQARKHADAGAASRSNS